MRTIAIIATLAACGGHHTSGDDGGVSFATIEATSFFGRIRTSP